MDKKFNVVNGADHINEIADTEKVCFSEPWSENAVKEFLSFDYNHALAALVDGAFAGYVTYSCICGEIQIANVAVVPEHRRKSVGSYILTQLTDKARAEKTDLVTLEVRSANFPAIKLYEKHGFKRVGVRKGYYKNPTDDALLMTKVL